MTIGKVKIYWAQILWAIAGLLMLSAALLTALDGHKDLAAIAIPLGLAMLLAGNINIFIFHRKHDIIHGSILLLADGMITAFLSIFLLFNTMIESKTIPFFFGIWELVCGVLKLIESWELRSHRYYGWHRFCIVGAIEILSGVASLLKPVDDYLGMHFVVAMILFVQSLGYLFKILIYPQLISNKTR